DEEILNSTEELSALIPLLLKEGTTDQRYTIDEYKKIAAARRSDINKRLESIPARIDEAQKAIPDLEGIVEENVDKEIARLDGEIRAAEFERSTSAPADHTAAIRQEISRLEVLFSEKKADYQKDINLKNEKISTELNLARSEARTALQEVSKIKNELWEANRAHDKLVDLRAQLIQEFQEAQRLTFPESSTICPTCAQPLPAEKVAQMRSEFNLRKSKRLEEINRRGKTEANKETIAAMVEKRDQLASQVPILEDEYQRLTQRADDLSKQIYSPPPYDMTDEGRKIRADINELEKALSNPSVSPEMQAADEKINALRAEMRVAQEQKMKLALAKTQLARIAELEEEEKRLGTEFEGIEYGIYLCSLFTRAKVARLTERINSKFTTVRFRLFEEQINGGLKEGCEVMIPGADGRMVPYSYANNAARINAGLEIIGILSAHTGVKMPVVVDNAESVTRMISTDSQLIRLVVSAEDQKLRVEYGC
ncbi:MAG: hypothetical protein IJY04_03130, partial [Clostridia bacterium]|nr:hypothetical protein [Clostridia bacterium]